MGTMDEPPSVLRQNPRCLGAEFHAASGFSALLKTVYRFDGLNDTVV
jgi:hypothetical protein